MFQAANPTKQALPLVEKEVVDVNTNDDILDSTNVNVTHNHFDLDLFSLSSTLPSDNTTTIDIEVCSIPEVRVHNIGETPLVYFSKQHLDSFPLQIIPVPMF